MLYESPGRQAPRGGDWGPILLSTKKILQFVRGFEKNPKNNHPPFNFSQINFLKIPGYTTAGR